MKRTVRLSLGMSFIMPALILIAPHLAPPELVLIIFGGLLAALPDQKSFDRLRRKFLFGRVHSCIAGGEIIRWQENSSSKY